MWPWPENTIPVTFPSSGAKNAKLPSSKLSLPSPRRNSMRLGRTNFVSGARIRLYPVERSEQFRVAGEAVAVEPWQKQHGRMQSAKN